MLKSDISDFVKISKSLRDNDFFKVAAAKSKGRSFTDGPLDFTFKPFNLPPLFFAANLSLAGNETEAKSEVSNIKANVQDDKKAIETKADSTSFLLPPLFFEATLSLANIETEAKSELSNIKTNSKVQNEKKVLKIKAKTASEALKEDVVTVQVTNSINQAKTIGDFVSADEQYSATRRRTGITN
jgi:hypothetical protein